MMLKKVFGLAFKIGGFKVWIAKFIIEEIFEEIVEPIAKASITEAVYQYDVVDGKLIFTKIEKAKEDGNEEDYDDAVDDLYT